MKIPKSIRQAIKAKLATEKRPMGSGVLAEYCNNTQKSHRTPKQMSFILKQMAREGVINTIEVSKNGVNHHGNRRVRCEYILAGGIDDEMAD